MDWQWRGEYYHANRMETNFIKSQLEIPGKKYKFGNQDDLLWYQLPTSEQDKILKERLKEFTKKTYNKVKTTTKEVRTDTVCMRENPFYVDTVRAFRDRRYLYKEKLKVAQRNLADAIKNDPTR